MTNIEVTGDLATEAEIANGVAVMANFLYSDSSGEKAEGQKAAGTAVTVDVAYILAQIKAIQDDKVYLREAIETLSQMTDGDSGDRCAPGNLVGQAKARALGDVVKCRETTNQQLLNFYMTVYNDLKSQS